MNRRFLFILLALVGLLGIGLVVWFVLRPVLPFGGTTTQQPPPLQQRVETPFNPSNAAPTPSTVSNEKTDANSPEERERQAQAALNRQTLDFAARQGTYSNADGFESLRELFPFVTVELKTKLEARRVQLLRDHPTFGTAWSQSTRALSSQIETGSLPLGTRTTAVTNIQSQQTSEDARTGKTHNDVLITITFVKRGTVWTPSDVTFAPLVP